MPLWKIIKFAAHFVDIKINVYFLRNLTKETHKLIDYVEIIDNEYALFLRQREGIPEFNDFLFLAYYWSAIMQVGSLDAVKFIGT